MYFEQEHFSLKKLIQENKQKCQRNIVYTRNSDAISMLPNSMKKDHTYENNIKIFVHDNVKSVLVYKLNHFVTQSSLQDALVKFEEGGENILVMVVNMEEISVGRINYLRMKIALLQ